MTKPTIDGYWEYNNGVWWEPVEVCIKDGTFQMIGEEHSLSIEEDTNDDNWGAIINLPLPLR